METKKIHDMSDSEPEDVTMTDTTEPAKKKRNTNHTLSDSEGEETSAPPAKKMKTTVGDVKKAKAAANPTKPKCKYGDKCYRKNADHRKNFRHPPSGGAATANPPSPSTNSSTSDAPTNVKAKNEIAVGETVEIKSPYAETVYRIKRTSDSYYCTCPGWKNQNKAIDSRSCKHLRDHLGVEFENARVGSVTPAVATRGTSGTDSKPKGPSRIPQHKNFKPLLLAHKWTENVDPKGWWLSEKLDGVRAYWDGRAFYSRLGNRFTPPDWFIENYPTDMELDGELFGGRQKFQSTVSIVKNTDERWKEITYQVFDSPSLEQQPFEKRIQAIQEYFEEHDVATVKVLEQQKCRGKEHIKEELDRVEGLGGEGLMIRKPASKYEHGRSHSLLKIKTFYDADAVVIGHERGKGRFQNMTGALRCRMACGKEFSVGSGMSDRDRARPPKIGAIISYKFQELSNSGSPRFPSYLGERIDLTEPKDAIIREVKKDE